MAIPLKSQFLIFLELASHKEKLLSWLLRTLNSPRHSWGKLMRYSFRIPTVLSKPEDWAIISLQKKLSAFDEMESESSKSQLQYVAWVELCFLSDDQNQWLWKHKPGLWITLHSTKMDVQVAKSSSSGKWHFKELLCIDSLDREQCLHFKYCGFNVSGERFLNYYEMRETSLQYTSFRENSGKRMRLLKCPKIKFMV